ncbi:coadhesin-like isoform X2 [Haliotis rubra]|uniref:coadhesin-like isoform X2 n=1 Tax=Haliotis rubra TaxID=36100 RepID=UPI001EE53423|nr:coadhesin-like isoform X2 [Haliotis rubra]
MNLNGYCVFSLVLAWIVAAESKGKVTCFRKVKANGKCAGLVRKGSFETSASCCQKWDGYALRKQKVGKNRFKCTPCVGKTHRESKRQKKKLQKLRKEKHPKKERKVKPTVETQTAEPVVVVKPKESWYEPSKRTDVSYSYSDPEREKIRWGPWSPCSVTCGAGWRSRFKVCDDCDRNDYENVQSQPCMVNFYCPVDGNWGPWFPWQPCSLSCDRGFRIRQRKCNYPPPAYGGLVCPGQAENNQTCNEQPCPVDGSWGAWSEFSLCSTTCGQGVKRKTRACNSPAPSHGGKNCVGPANSNKKCQKVRCPQDGGWSLWGSWSKCAVTCGQGTRQRTRSCDSPRPLYGGKDCVGKLKETLMCYGGRPCPVDGGWSEWTNFGFCRAERCEKGFQVRSRGCNEPKPVHGGRPCDGDQYERIECFNDQGCPRNGSWCEWSPWSKCTATCKLEAALRVRQRECKCPAPRSGGAVCDGEGITVKTCDDLPPCKLPLPSRRSDTNAGGDLEGEGSGDGEEADEEEQDGSDNSDDYPDHTVMEAN